MKMFEANTKIAFMQKLCLAVLSFLSMSPSNFIVALPLYVSHKDCNNAPSGKIIANPSNCQQYIQCNGLRSTLGECPPNTFFNAQKLSCDKSRLVCEQKLTTIAMTTTAPTTTPPLTTALPQLAITTATAITTPSIALSTQFWRPTCLAWYDQQYPHPFQCEYYYHCVRGFLAIRRCSYGYGWDVQTQQCTPMRQAQCFRSQTYSIFSY